MVTNCFRSVRYDWNQASTVPERLRWSDSLWRRMEWEVKEDEEADVVGVGSNEEVIGDPDEGGLCAMVGLVAGLKGLVELVA